MQEPKHNPKDRREVIGLTTTVPVELIFAAGMRPLDLNNAFIASPDAATMVKEAEEAGFPNTCCSWAKGVYAAARRLHVDKVVAVVQGDCSNTHAIAELLHSEGVTIIPFAFPYGRDREVLKMELDRFACALGTTLDAGEEWKARLDEIRALAHRIDDLTWCQGTVSGAEDHLWLISCSDFMGSPEHYAREAAKFLNEREKKSGESPALRLGLVGIPPICQGLFELIEERGARILFNEIPRQFAMPYRTGNLVEQYVRYTYPYDIFGRIRDIKEQMETRRLDGVIHYVQSFCFRQVQDRILRQESSVPILTLECDKPGPLDGRTRTRVEAFLEMLEHK